MRIGTYRLATALYNSTVYKAYSKDILVQHGWRLAASEPNLLIFLYSHSIDIPKGETKNSYASEYEASGTYSNVEVSIYPGESGKITVELE